METEKLKKEEITNLIRLYRAFYAHTEEEFNAKKEKGIEYEEISQNLFCPKVYCRELMRDIKEVEGIDNLWRNFRYEFTRIQEGEEYCRYIEVPEFETDIKFMDILFEDYRNLQSVLDMNIFRTLKSVELIEKDFNRDFSDPIRSARAINTLLETVDSYVREKVKIKLVKNNLYRGATIKKLTEKERIEWAKAKVRYNLELLEPEKDTFD